MGAIISLPQRGYALCHPLFNHMSHGSLKLEGEKEKGWVSQPMKWYLMPFQRVKKWGRKNKGKKGGEEEHSTRMEADEQWHRSGKVWRAIVNNEGQLEIRTFGRMY